MAVRRSAWWLGSRHAQDSISSLAVEELGFSFYAPESVLKVIKVFVVFLSEVDLVWDDYSFVITTFSITLVKLTPIITDTIALVFRAGTEFMCCWFQNIVVGIDVISALLTETFARDSSDTRASVHNQSLGLPFRANINSHIEIL